MKMVKKIYPQVYLAEKRKKKKKKMTKLIDLELDLDNPGDPNGSNDSNSE